MSTKYRIANLNEIAPGEMKSCPINDDQSVLLVNAEGELHAYAPECPHHGAPLADGLLFERRILCPWHLAQFDAQTGGPLQPPSMDGLPEFAISIDGDDVYVTLPDKMPSACTPEMVNHDADADGRVFAIVGAGAAGTTAAETLRIEGFRGRVILISAEPDAPYDRTDLSKRYLQQKDASVGSLRSTSFYQEHDIEFLPGEEVVGLDPKARTIVFRDKEAIRYDRALLATGAEPRTLGVDGEDLENINTLRRLGQADRIRAAIKKGKPAVVVGASFIGMEVAASLAKRGMTVTVVSPESVPFERPLGKEVGGMYKKVHEDEGVKFQMGRTVHHFEGEAGMVATVVLDNGARLDAHLAVIGVGVRPATGFLRHVAINDDGSVNVDNHLRVEECDDLFAAGDVAQYPDWRGGGRVRIEHWRVAGQQGRVAALNMLDRDETYHHVPFFWTNQYMVITDYLGHVSEWDDLIVDGSLDDQQFVIYYILHGHVQAVASCGASDTMLRISEALAQTPLPTVDDLRSSLQIFTETSPRKEGA